MLLHGEVHDLTRPATGWTGQVRLPLAGEIVAAGRGAEMHFFVFGIGNKTVIKNPLVLCYNLGVSPFKKASHCGIASGILHPLAVASGTPQPNLKTHLKVPDHAENEQQLSPRTKERLQ